MGPVTVSVALPRPEGRAGAIRQRVTFSDWRLSLGDSGLLSQLLSLSSPCAFLAGEPVSFQPRMLLRCLDGSQVIYPSPAGGRLGGFPVVAIKNEAALSLTCVCRGLCGRRVPALRACPERDLGVTDAVSFGHCQGGKLRRSQLQQSSSRILFGSRDVSPLAGVPVCSETNWGTPRSW